MEKENSRTFHIAGNYIEKQEFHITGGTNYINTPNDSLEDFHGESEGDSQDKDTPLVEELKPIFYNNEKDVREFLKLIKGMGPNDITDLVNKWVTEKRISDYGYSRKGQLWKILHDAGLYDKTQQNWNRRVQ